MGQHTDRGQRSNLLLPRQPPLTRFAALLPALWIPAANSQLLETPQ